MSSLVSCFLTVRLHLGHCDIDSHLLLLVSVFLSIYIHIHIYILSPNLHKTHLSSKPVPSQVFVKASFSTSYTIVTLFSF